MPPKFVTS